MKKNNLFALGLAASLAATGCDNDKAEPAQVSPETVNTPAQSAQPAPEAAKLTSKLTQAEDNAICSRLYPAVGPRFAIVEDGHFSVVDCTRKEVTQILNGCNNNYNDNVASIVDAKCSRDADMYRNIAITAIVNEDGTRKKGVYTYSDRAAKTSIELNPHSAKNFLYNDVTGTDRFSPTAKIWWPNLNATANVSTTPSTPAPKTVRPPKEVVQPSNKDLEQDRRLSAVEKRLDGHDQAIHTIQVQVGDMMVKANKQNTKDGHSIAADAVK